MTLREWLEERAKRGQRIVNESYGGVLQTPYSPTMGADDLLAEMDRSGSLYVMFLREEVHEDVFVELYAEYGKVGHMARTHHMHYLYFDDQ
jgi:hypothetical protein